MHLFSSRRNPGAVALGVVVFFLAFSTTVFAQEFDTPEALVDEWASLMTHDCDLECAKKVASMYSEQFLLRNKNALVNTLRNSADRTNDALILFGEDIKQKELVQMSPSDVFAHQLYYKDRSVPDAYRYSQTEIISKQYISPREVKVVVRRSGLPAAPQMSEDEIVHLIKEGGEWRLRY